ncbi:MAG: NAD(P)/FAD-dependent oxidoreductase [Acidimicrobiaceae bacterium]|nr:NAD(P)/FAD-dependent oxidoreductase [Acidimicrobiaceae bacterium]
MALVGILGAGLSGVVMGIQLKRLGIDDFVVYEKQSDVGGTWLRNTYPGLHCDIPSHIYCYSFEPNPDFSMVFSGHSEIQAYIRSCAEKYGIADHIRLNTTVDRASWQPHDSCWELELAEGERLRHRFVVSATGGLTEPHYPTLDGFDSFEGLVWHAGSWRHDVELAGRRVAVVGSAAAAVQVVPEVAKDAAEVFVYSRTPNWVRPRRNRFYTDEEKAELATDEGWHRARRQQYRDTMLWQRAFEKKTDAIEELRAEVMDQMRAAISDPDTIAALTPSFEPGCKRILVSDDYYPALALDHVTLVPHGVTALTPSGVVSADGTEVDVDVVIFCTGYKLGGRADGGPALEIYGRDGLDLRTAFGRAPESFRGVAIPGFPNWFTVAGVNGSPGHAPVFMTAEVATNYIGRWIHHLLARDANTVEARRDATHEWAEATQAELQEMSWAGDCGGWYRDRNGRILPFFPGSWTRFRREMRELHLDAFEVR